MKLSKNLGRIATTFLATAMLASVSAVPAFAVESEPTTPPSGLQTGATITIDKNLKVGQNAYTPDTTFNFKVTPAAPVADNPETTEVDETEKHNNIVVEQGPTDGVKFKTGADFDVSDEAMTQDTTVTKQATLEVDLTKFENLGPGVYKYTVEEDNTTKYEGVTYDESVKTLYVTVITNASGELEVKNTELYNADGKTKSNAFNNDYDVDYDTLHDVTITKQVVGEFGDLENDTFTFNISVKGQANEKYKIVYAETAGGATQTSYILSNDEKAKTITVKNGGYVTIYGLSEGDSYTVTETNYADKGYTAYVDADYDASEYTGGKTYKENATKGDTITDTTNEDTQVVIFNEKSGTVATGVMMDIAPYALLVVVAAAGCFVFLRKRRED